MHNTAKTGADFLSKKGVDCMDRLSLLLVIVGAINWGLVGLFQFDLVAFLFGGQSALIARVLYTIIGAAGVWSISMLFTSRESRTARGGEPSIDGSNA